MAWKRFLFVQLPAALVVSAVLAEGTASALSGVAPRRHDLDHLVGALAVAKVDAAVVLAGDSVTQDVMKTYRIAPDGVVANLTTNQASGLIGTAFLLRRYLERNAPPTHVVIASTPEFYAYQPGGVAAHTYLTSVFRRDDEQAALRRLGIAQAEDWRPAALALAQRIGEPLTGLGGMGSARLPAGEQAPEQRVTEGGPVPVNVAAQIAQRAALSLGVSPSAHEALDMICDLAGRHGFTLHLVRAPIPQSVLAARGGDDGWRDLQAAAAKCPRVVVDDVNRRERFPDYAFRDADHLQRPGWTAVYARLLADLVAPLAAHPQE